MDSIRITSGIFRGRIIKSPKMSSTHPMGAREKLALFNMISEVLPGAAVLDAFAGSGALGIGALSRGAESVDFVENNKKVSQVIKENLANLGLSEKVFPIGVKQLKTDKEYDLILADPPYDDFKIDEIVYLTKYLKDGGTFVLSHPGDTPVIPGLKLTNSRKYAAATISIYEKTV